jgi:MFS family permease
MRERIRLITGLQAAGILAMTGFSTFASLLVELSRLWHLDPARAGWIASAYLVGYAVGVPVLVGLTDRIDSRAVYAGGCAIGFLSGAGFASVASGFWSAVAFRAIAGVSLAATYMPGLRILTDRLPSKARIRSVPYYTATFGIGVSLSFWMSGWVAQRYGWQAAFYASGLGPVVAAITMFFGTSNTPVGTEMSVPAVTRNPLDFRPVFKNRDALAYVLAYGGHAWELFGFRAWLPAYLLFVWTRFGARNPGATTTNLASVITIASVPASILGAEFAMRWSRSREIRAVALASVAVGFGTAVAGTFSVALATLALFLWAFAISADSGALTAGAVTAMRPGEQGATLAVYSLVGFVGGAVGPIAAGAALSSGGGLDMPLAWWLALPAIAAGSALTALAMLFAPHGAHETEYHEAALE